MTLFPNAYSVNARSFCAFDISGSHLALAQIHEGLESARVLRDSDVLREVRQPLA